MIERLKKVLSDTRGLVSDLSGLTVEIGTWVLLLIAFYDMIQRHLQVVHRLLP